jgi:hypothetical protein
MRRQVWKFPLAATGVQLVHMPAGAQILSVQLQGDTLSLWALCEVDREPTDRAIAIYGTGHEMPSTEHGILKFISTFQLDGGRLVFHVFELVRE